MTPPEFRWWSEPCSGGCKHTIMVWAGVPGVVVAHPDCPLPENPADAGGPVHYVKDSGTRRVEDGHT